MINPDRLEIIQIIPVTKPLVAVFKDEGSPIGIWFSEVYAIELVENKNKIRYERGVITWNIEFVNTDNILIFLGYAKDEADAVKLYGKKGEINNATN